jgi:histidine ammonia-lyase
MSFAEATAADQREQIAAALGNGTAAAYLAVRSVATPVIVDRPLDADIRAIRRMIERGELLRRVEVSMGGSLSALYSG